MGGSKGSLALVTSYWLLVISYLILDAGRWRLDPQYWMGCESRLLVIGVSVAICVMSTYKV